MNATNIPMHRLILIIALMVCSPAMAADCVVLLHGLGRTSYSMAPLQKALLKSGYQVVNENYPSRQKAVGELVAAVDDGVQRCRALKPARIHFVTHSLGGILVRAYFQGDRVAQTGRVVMLAPPNHGSEIADAYAKTWWYRFFVGPAGQQLGTGAQGIAQQLQPISLEVGVIAGTKSIDPWFASVMPSPHDGKVSVASARLAEMRDFITVPYTHTFMARREAVSRQVLEFLAEGRFNHAE